MAINKFTPLPSNIFFVDPVYVKQHTSLNENIDDKIIQEGIQTAQDMFILPILGSTLFEEMLQSISAGTLSGIYLNLVTQFIQPILANASVMNILPFISFQMKNKGLMTQKSEFSDPAQRSDIEWLVGLYRAKAAFYAQRCTQFMYANTDIFPEYLNPQLGTASNGADLFYPNRTSYGAGMFIQGGGNNPPGKYSGYGLSANQFLDFIGDE